jgi:hypothetical protein
VGGSFSRLMDRCKVVDMPAMPEPEPASASAMMGANNVKPLHPPLPPHPQSQPQSRSSQQHSTISGRKEAASKAPVVVDKEMDALFSRFDEESLSVCADRNEVCSCICDCVRVCVLS